MPYKTWPNPASVNEENLFGDKDKLLNGQQYNCWSAFWCEVDILDMLTQSWHNTYTTICSWRQLH
jgi:hypothetical protein